MIILIKPKQNNHMFWIKHIQTYTKSFNTNASSEKKISRTDNCN